MKEQSGEEAAQYDGIEGRECGEHRPLGIDYAYCYICSEKCSAITPCMGCELPILRALLADARTEIDRWGYGDFHYGSTPRDPDVLRMLARIDAVLGTPSIGSSGEGE